MRYLDSSSRNAYAKNLNLVALVERFLWPYKEINFVRVLTVKSFRGNFTPPPPPPSLKSCIIVKTLIKMDFSSCHRNYSSQAIDLKICT